MKRDPSLHIKRSQLRELLETNNINHCVGKAQADLLLKICAPYSVVTRSVTVSTKRMEEKVKQIIQSTRLDSDRLSEIIYATRQRLKHQSVTRMKPNGKYWGTLKEITAHALDFCIQHQLTKRKGFLTYVEIGLSKMNKFNITKFLNLYEPICETYLATKELEKDEDPKLTQELYEQYSQTILNRTGIFEDFKDQPSKYIWFVKARRQAEDLNVSLEIYLEAQFEGLDFNNGIPYPSQLVGSKANERLTKYLYKYKLKLDKNRTK